MEQKIGTVLVVDDEPVILEMLKAKLVEEYTVLTANSAEKALDLCDNAVVNLVISDINMPGMKGYELLTHIKKKYPATKTVLMTSYNINDYVRLAKTYDISNILTKSVPFNFNEFSTMVKNLITEEIFGLDKYLLEDYSLVSAYDITNSNQIDIVEEEIVKQLSLFTTVSPYVNILIEELITNAVYHAPVDEGGKRKYRKHSDVILEDSEKVEVCLGRDSEKYGLSVLDTSGLLTKDQVLSKFDRHIHEEGLLDEDGRGLHISRVYSDRMIINVKREVATEVIILNYLDRKYKGYKPLHINEV